MQCRLVRESSGPYLSDIRTSGGTAQLEILHADSSLIGHGVTREKRTAYEKAKRFKVRGTYRERKTGDMGVAIP